MKKNTNGSSTNCNNTIHTSSVFHIKSLDGIRAIAALIVFVSHAGWGHIIPGLFGVTIFFFLSGYLITTLLRREFEHTGSISFKNFYLRRAYRIFPPFYIILILALTLSLQGIFTHNMSPLGIFSQFSFWTNYYSIFYDSNTLIPATGVYWSLSNEEHFYFVFPFIFWLSIKRLSNANIALFFFTLCLLVLAWRYYIVFYQNFPPAYTQMATDARFDSLLFGCIMGVWKNPALDGDIKYGKFGRYCIFFIAIAILIICLLFRDEIFRSTLRYTLQGIALFPIFWLAVYHHQWPIFRLLNWQPIRFLGNVSYSFYLSHVIFLHFLEANLHIIGIPRAIFGFILTLIFATLMYNLVERPIGKLRRYLHNDI